VECNREGKMQPMDQLAGHAVPPATLWPESR
jgi:hypothetical protein